MVSNLSPADKYAQVQRNYCFYLDIQDHEISRSLSRRIQELGLQQEVFLSVRVTHVVQQQGGWARREPARAVRARADAMLDRVRSAQHASHNYVLLTVPKAIKLLDILYDTYIAATRYASVRAFSKQFIKIEFLDKICRPIYKEFDVWPEIVLDQDIPKEKNKVKHINNNISLLPRKTAGDKMTRKNRTRIREKDDKDVKAGYCEMCNTDYLDASAHRKSQTHLAFIKDPNNFIGLDSLITETDVNTFLDKSAPVNGERRSLRKLCNGDIETPKRRSKRSQSPDTTVNGDQSPNCNGVDDERKHNTRCNKKSSESHQSEDRQYYKVVGVSTKLRSSGGFKKKESPPMYNGSKPLVVKFRKVRRSELSVLSDEAEQFMFPKRASSTSSTSSDEDDKPQVTKRKSPPQPPLCLERRRLARPLALKEESSEEDSWIEDKRKRRRRAPAVGRRARRVPNKTIRKSTPDPEHQPEPEVEPTPVPEPVESPPEEVTPLRRDPTERCMKWEDGKLKYNPIVEQLEFAFESVPHSEPWYETFSRQDKDKIVTKNVPRFFALYSKSPKLPYEIGHLPPLKPNCCPLSDLVKREEKPGPSRSAYGTRGMKQQKIRKRTAAILALEGHPRKSPREHASTLAILGSAGLLHRRKHAEDTKSTASEDTISDTQSTIKIEPVLSEAQQTSERLQQFLSEVFDDAHDYDVSDEAMEGEPTLTTSTNVPDVLSLVSECEDCDIIRNEIKVTAFKARGRRGKVKKKNRTGWPKKKKQVKKGSRTNSSECDTKVESSADRSSAEPDDETTQDTITEGEQQSSETEHEKTLIQDIPKSEVQSKNQMDVDLTENEELKVKLNVQLENKSLQIDVKVLLQDKSKEDKSPTKQDFEKKEEKRKMSSASETEDREDKMKKKKRALQGLGWLQPVVRVARVDAARRLRSAGRARPSRLR